jgi:uncharacterized membrane protein
MTKNEKLWGLSWRGWALLCTLIGLVLRVYKIHLEAPWFDEVATFPYANAATFLEYVNAMDDAAWSPVYLLIQYAWAQCFGNEVLTMRCLALLFSLPTIPLMARIGNRYYGVYGAAIAGICVAAIPLHIQHGQSIRFYAILWFFAVYSMDQFAVALETNRKSAWIGHSIVNVLMIFCHLFTVFLFAVQGMTLILQRKNWRTTLCWIGVHAGFVLLLGAYLSQIDTADAAARTDWLPHVQLFGFTRMAGHYTGAGSLPPRVYAWLPVQLLQYAAQAGLLLLFAGALLSSALQVFQNRERREGLHVALLWFWLPIVLLTLLSLLVRPSFLARYVGYASFGLYLLLAATITALKTKRNRNLLFGVFLALLCIQNAFLWHTRPMRTDFVTIARFMDEKEPDIPLLTIYPHSQATLAYQFRDTQRPVLLASTLEDFIPQYEKAVAQDGSCFILFDMYGKPYKEALEKWLTTNNRAYTRHIWPGRHIPVTLYHCLSANR